MEDIETQATDFAAQIWCRPENGQREMDVDFAMSIAEAVKPLLRQRRDAAEALLWASGSPDFNPGGRAELGWNEIARPAIEAIFPRPAEGSPPTYEPAE